MGLRDREDARDRAQPGRFLTADDASPLILTATLEAAAQAHFDRLRERHFPFERNHLAAHLTLFHALPAEHFGVLVAAVEAAAARPSLRLRVSGVRLLGRGVAYTVTSPELIGLRSNLARAWEPWLTPQDRSRGDLHVTVQNKVSPVAARALRDDLLVAFEPSTVEGTGLALWRYHGGPWEAVASFPFAGR